MQSIDYEHPKEEELYDFSTALDELKKGKKITRTNWNWNGLFLTLQVPDKNSFMTVPYVYISVPKWNGWYKEEISRVPWLASQTDLLSEDWIILD